MVLAFLKNALFPASASFFSKSAGYGTMKEGEPDCAATPFQADIDVEAGVGANRSEKKWKLNPRVISDAIIGLSDGLTVPFALTAGLSGLGDTRVVVLGGLAELMAGAISMGLGGFIGAKSEAESYQATVCSTRLLITNSPSQAETMVEKTFEPYGLPSENVALVKKSLKDNPELMLDFLMRFHLQQAEPETSRPLISAATIAGGYFIGGFIPLLPYFAVSRSEVMRALWYSVGIMSIALFAFGWVKTGIVCGWAGRMNILASLKGAMQMVVVGGLAAGAAVGLVRVISDH